MATNTVNYQLNKPDPVDFYDIQVQNHNMDLLDSALKDLQDTKVDKLPDMGLSHEDFTPEEKMKLEGIAEGANKYVHPDTHPASIIQQNASNRFITDLEREKLAGMAVGANKYVHPATHPASIIEQDASNRFVTDAEKASWTAKIGKTEFDQSRTYTATHSKSGTVHTLTGLPTVAGIYTVQFKATADFAEGNTFAGGYTAKPNGEETALPDKAFVVGDIVSVTVDAGGKKLGFKLGGKGFPDGWNQIITAKTGENIQKFSPVVMVKGVDGSIETKTKILNNPDIPIEGNKINDAKFSADGNYVAFVGDTTPSLNIYNQYKSTFTKNTNIDVLPAGIAYSVDFDPTGQYLAVGHSSFPYATIYDITRDKFIKIPNLESLPTGACKKVSFNSTGEYLLVIYDTAPYFSIYRVTNGAFLNLVKPSSITKTNIKDISFSANGSYFSIFDYNNMISIYKLNANTISLIHEVDTGRTPAEELVWGNKENIFVVRNRPIESSPLALYRVDGDTVTKVSTTTVLWSAVDSLTFDSTDTYLIMIRRDFDGVIVSDFNTRSETSNIMLYKIEGGTFIELTDPTPMINGELNSFAFDSTSNYLAIGSYASPYIGFYKRNDDKFIKMGDYYYTSPPNTIKKILFSPVGFCSITIPSSSTKFSVYKLNEIDGYINSISNPTIKLERDNNGLSVAFDPLGEYFAFGGIGSDDSIGVPYPSHFVCRQEGGMFIYEHE